MSQFSDSRLGRQTELGHVETFKAGEGEKALRQPNPYLLHSIRKLFLISNLKVVHTGPDSSAFQEMFIHSFIIFFHLTNVYFLAPNGQTLF